jgi:glycosyltransferase involved in cell wall biosynthesis
MYTKEPTGVGVYTREVWNKLYEKLESANVEYLCYAYTKENLNKTKRLSQIKLPFVLQYLFSSFISFHRLIWNLIFLPFIARRYDLVYSFSSHGSPFIKNQIVTIHDLVCFSFPKQHRFQFLYFKYIMPFIISASRKVVVISEFTKSEVIKYYKIDPNKIEVILSGGDHLKYTDTFLLSPEEKKMEERIDGKKFFLTVGASYSHKNIERLIEATNQMPVKSSLVVIGAVNKYYYKLRKFVSEKNIENVIFLEYVSPNFLNALYKKCIANVYISFKEGFGFPPFEAAMNNKISVVSNSGALPEIYSDTVCYVNPYNIEDISKMLTLVASDNFKHCEYQKKIPALLNKYKWSNTVNEIAELVFSCSIPRLCKVKL